MKIKEVLEKTTVFFKEKKLPSARLDAEILISFGLQIRRIDLYLKFDQPLDEKELESLRALVKRRATGEPIAYILGEKEFFGEMFYVNPSVLIPRPESEDLVENALAWISQRSFDHPVRVLDLGAGSGCIGISILKKSPKSICSMIEASPGAVEVIHRNLDRISVRERAEVLQVQAEDLSWLDSRERLLGHRLFDVVLANPPYIAEGDLEVEESVKTFEPHLALFSGDHGLKYLKSWSEIYKDFLADEALVLFEMGYQQGNVMYDHFRTLGVFSDVQVLQDLSGKDRIILGIKNG